MDTSIASQYVPVIIIPALTRLVYQKDNQIKRERLRLRRKGKEIKGNKIM